MTVFISLENGVNPRKLENSLKHNYMCLWAMYWYRKWFASCPSSGVWDGLFEAPQPSSDCAVSELGGGVLPAGAAGRPPVARRCNERCQLWTCRGFPPSGTHCADTTWPACRPHHPPKPATQPAHHQRQHHVRPGLEGFLSHSGMAGVLPAAGQSLTCV